jgi:hypothetical protein
MTGEPNVTRESPVKRDPGDDTVELELTAEEQLTLSQAAKVMDLPHKTAAWTAGYDTYVCKRTERIDRACTVTFAAVILGITAVTGVRALVAPSNPAPTIVTPIIRYAAVPVKPAAPVVQVANPFDSAEVFEFPAATTEHEARDAIAELLLQRARERAQAGLLRARSRPAIPHTSAATDVFVTRLSVPTGEFAGLSGLRAETEIGE